jgi:branched-chain amino acid transport system permease protein
MTTQVHPHRGSDIGRAERVASRGIDYQLVAGAVLIIGSAIGSALLGNAYWHHNTLLVNLFISVAVLQNLLLADAGQVSFGQGAVFGVAAYTCGIVIGLHGGGPAWAGYLAGIAAALVLGLLFALPALRVQGYYLGFVTLSAAVVFPELLTAFNDITNGINGITIAAPAWARPIAGHLSSLSLVIVGFTCCVLAGHVWLRRTSLGRRMRVAAQSPEAAQTLGISPGHMRFLAFTLAALGTGIAGVLYVPLLGFVSPYAFRFELSIFFFFAVIVGGTGRLLGPIAGVLILYLVPNALLVDLAQYRLLGYGIAALLIMLLFPDGVVGTVERFFRSRQLASPGPVSLQGIIPAHAGVSEPARTSQAAVVIRGVSKSFGRMVALDNVDLTVKARTIHGLVGPNGSGKTTLLNILSGLNRPDRGSVAVGGKPLAGLAPHKIPRLGMGRTFQTPRVFDDMSVSENLQLGSDSGLADKRQFLDPGRAFGDEWIRMSAENLPHAQRRMLELMRVLAMQPDVILLDEPAAGLAPDERDALAQLLRSLRDQFGKTIILVEHDLGLVWRLADHISVLDTGVVVADGPPSEIMANPRVRALFTGEQHA